MFAAAIAAGGRAHLGRRWLKVEFEVCCELAEIPPGPPPRQIDQLSLVCGP